MGLRTGVCVLSLAVIILLKMSGLCQTVHQTGDNGHSGEWAGGRREEKWEIAFLLYLLLSYLNGFHNECILISLLKKVF